MTALVPLLNYKGCENRRIIKVCHVRAQERFPYGVQNILTTGLRPGEILERQQGPYFFDERGVVAAMRTIGGGAEGAKKMTTVVGAG